MRLATRLVGAAVVATAIVAGGYLLDGPAAAGDDPPVGPGVAAVDLDVRYSEFSFSELTVRPGTVVDRLPCRGARRPGARRRRPRLRRASGRRAPLALRSGP